MDRLSAAQFPPALGHGPVEEIFPNVFFVTGAMETVLQGMDWAFSRNMTVVRDGERLIIFNSVRLTDEALAGLDSLGRVTDVVRLGALHGRDDPFYVDRYQANYWALPEMIHESGLQATHTLAPDSLPLADAGLFVFETTKIPEAVVLLKREGGIAIACDALQNWLAPDQFFSDASSELMQQMGFFTPANIGPVWMQAAEPAAGDFVRLAEIPFSHALCGHGEPLRDSAQADYQATFSRLFGI
ncbi:hypothetical protein [Pseudomaricurvus sp. HS19]|uniref:hypothetical protein n=1 Tax=Pseudomaricurvus sp. HS19 TaxID=2692626 RepID=UPI00136E7DEF|nr:hypothetical protein [Pseudomaricurvus sp. HS19]MYM64902.1 hypothetical protein [Pseudomaricurvus sp. HS19]